MLLTTTGVSLSSSFVREMRSFRVWMHSRSSARGVLGGLGGSDARFPLRNMFLVWMFCELC